MLGDALDVSFFEYGTGCLATICATEAIGLGKSRIVCAMKQGIEIIFSLFFPAGKEALDGFAKVG